MKINVIVYKKFYSILLVFAFSVKGQNASAREFKGVTPVNSNGVSRMPYEFDGRQKNSKLAAKLRLPINLVPYKKVVLQDQYGKNNTHFVPHVSMVNTLRARLDRTNHFYLDQYHITTTPQSWNKENGEFSMTVTIHRTFGANQQIEEQMGNIKLNGQLVGGPDVYRFIANAKQTYYSKKREPLLDVQIGWPEGNTFSRSETKEHWNGDVKKQSKPAENLTPQKNKQTPQSEQTNTKGWSKG